MTGGVVYRPQESGLLCAGCHRRVPCARDGEKGVGANTGNLKDFVLAQRADETPFSFTSSQQTSNGTSASWDLAGLTCGS